MRAMRAVSISTFGTTFKSGVARVRARGDVRDEAQRNPWQLPKAIYRGFCLVLTPAFALSPITLWQANDRFRCAQRILRFYRSRIACRSAETFASSTRSPCDENNGTRNTHETNPVGDDNGAGVGRRASHIG
jgi:hypothetical protein